MHYVYIVRCKDNSLYTGYTPNIEKRVVKHNEGKGAKYTKSRGPVVLIHSEVFDTIGEALKRERAIKKKTKVQKEALCQMTPKKIAVPTKKRSTPKKDTAPLSKKGEKTVVRDKGKHPEQKKKGPTTKKHIQ